LVVPINKVMEILSNHFGINISQQSTETTEETKQGFFGGKQEATPKISIKKTEGRIRWTEEMNEYIKKNGAKATSEHYGLPIKPCRSQRGKVLWGKKSTGKYTKWTVEMKDFLSANGPNETKEKYGVRISACRKKYYELRKKEGRPQRPVGRPKGKKNTKQRKNIKKSLWTPKIREYLLNNGPHQTRDKYGIKINKCKCMFRYLQKKGSTPTIKREKVNSRKSGTKWTDEMCKYLMEKGVRETEERYGVTRKQCYDKKYVIRKLRGGL